MSAGSGITHSEMNANKDKEVKFLQVWVFLKAQDIAPLSAKDFRPEDRQNQHRQLLRLNSEAVLINQDAWFSLEIFPKILKPYALNKTGNGVYALYSPGPDRKRANFKQAHAMAFGNRQYRDRCEQRSAFFIN